ncbi:BcNRPS1, nonribosomal peptide synthetase [Xylaria arbuscula]|nr:BcNRPS1, nonribosomal peptide synthetase [Xylaria arbuscula]
MYLSTNIMPSLIPETSASINDDLAMSKTQTKSPFISDVVVLQHISHVLGMAVEDLSLGASFISQGGHSLLAMKLASQCRASGIQIAVGAILLAQSLREILNAATVAQNTISTVEVVETVGNKELSTNSAHTLDFKNSITVDTVTEVHPASDSELEYASKEVTLTEMQLSFVHSFMNKPGTNVISFSDTYKTAHIPSIRAAWKRVIEAEPIFKLSFAAAGAGKVVELSQALFIWNETAVESREEYEAALELDVSPQTIEVSFDVITLSSEDISTVIWRVHHAFIDGLSAQSVYNKFHGALAGKDVIAGPPFRHVVQELREYQRVTMTDRKEFWAMQAAKHPQPVCDIGLGTAPAEGPKGMDSVSISVPFERIRAKARALGVSVPSWYQAAWALVLSLYADSDSVAFGLVLSGRDLPVNGAADTIGPLINTLPFNVTLNQSANVADYLRSIFRHSVELSRVQCSVPEDGFTRKFTTALAMEFEMIPADDQGIQPIGPSRFKTIPDIPLSIYMNYSGEIRLCFQKSKYLRGDMELLAEHFHTAIMRLCSSTCTIGEITASLLTTSSKDRLTNFGNCLSSKTSSPFITEDLVTLFEKASRENPTSPAVEKSGKTLSYAELDLLASRMASKLANQCGVAPGDVVCVHADRSLNWIVAIFAILKVGAVYSAQDAALPPQIRDTNFQTAGAKLFVTPSTTQKNVKPESCLQCLSVEELIGSTAVEAPTLEHRAVPRPSDNAYLCFTSGSTGKPKGVMCHHAGLVAFQITPEVRFFAAPGQRISQLMSPAFDGSIHEIFSALSYGATLVLGDEDGDPFSHLKKVNAAILTPSIAKILEPSDYTNLTTVYCVGEPMPQYVNDAWSEDSKRRLYNMYGPTEATCGATIQRLLPGKKVAIGKPNTTTRVYVLDRNRRLLPPGVVGEIYCAGVQVARGYIGRPELTAERFLPDTICDRDNELMYRTGDRGFFNGNGEVECLGRNDRQIKLRGYRLDLNDLEIRIAQAAKGVTAVAICPDGDHLVCMLQPETLDVADVRATARKVMPVHAVPKYIVPVDRFPMTPAGKIDYKEVASRCSSKSTEVAKQRPMSASQLALAQVWRETLAVQEDVEINSTSNFVALGGHSVMQLQLASRLAKIHGISNPLPFIIRSATLAELAAAINSRKAEKSAVMAGQRIVPLGNNRASPIEEDWFFKYELNFKGTSSFNVSYACAVDPARVDTERLIGAWNVVLARHRIFRSRFIPCPDAKGGVHRLVTRYGPQVTRVAAGKKFSLWREVNRPFRLDCDENLIRVLVSKTKMLVVVSHILTDLTTLQTVLRELALVYNGEVLSPVKRTYEQTVQWSQPVTSAQGEWWKKNLEGSSRDFGIPDALRLERTSYGGKTLYSKLSHELSHRLIRYTEETKTTLHQLALASVAMAMQIHRNDTDIVLGAPYLNREAEDMETVGLFLEPLPIRINFEQGSAGDGAGNFMAAVQEASQQAVSHAIPWHCIIKATGADKDKTRLYPNHPLLDIMVTFHDHRASAKNKWMAIQGLEPMITQTKGSKFLLLVEFSAVSDGVVLLRIEYDNECIPKSQITRVQQLITEAMGMIIDGRGYSDTKRALQSIPYQPETELAARKEISDFFGKRLDSLAAL